MLVHGDNHRALRLRAFARRFGVTRLGVLAALAALAALPLGGCTPTIGDKCTLSTDCSIRGDRVCDTSQPDGYCTVPACRGDGCPDKAACILFRGSVPGCAYDDRTTARTGRTFCMKTCSSDSDCRDGYVCRDPRSAPWKAIIQDDVQEQTTCLPRPASESASFAAPNPAVCQAGTGDAPAIPATPGTIDYGDAGADAGEGGAPDGGAPDGGDGGAPDAGRDAGDGG